PGRGSVHMAHGEGGAQGQAAAGRPLWKRLLAPAKRLLLRLATYADRPRYRCVWVGINDPLILPPRYRCVSVGGFRLYVDVKDPLIGACFAAGAPYERHLTAALRAALRPGDTFLDLGANMGYYTMLAASRVGPGGRVIAFEPRHDNV